MPQYLPPPPLKPVLDLSQMIAVQRTIDDFRLHEAPHTDITGNGLNRCGSHLLGVLDFYHLDSYVDFATLNQRHK